MEKINHVGVRKIDSFEANYASLSRDCSLKMLEKPAVYNRDTGELYNLNSKSLKFIDDNQNVSSDDVKGNEFVQYLVGEGIYEPRDEPVDKRQFNLKQSPSPSLRYMLIHLTSDCNLKCRHCYLGEPEKQVNPYEDVMKVIDDVQDMQGLTVLLSGGEALKHKDFWKINDRIPEYDMTFYLLTNGTLVTEENAKRLNIKNVQVSLDGLEEGHDFMRGRGRYKESIAGVENLIKAGKRMSIATMVHKKNLNEFEEMEKVLMGYGIDKWIITSPCDVGRWERNREYEVDVKTAAPIIKRYCKNVEGPHKSTTIYSCGTHMLALMPNGVYSSCPVMQDSLGKVDEVTIEEAWKNKKRIKVDELTECKPCKTLESCKGGCRHNALSNGNIYGKDPLACEILSTEVK